VELAVVAGDRVTHRARRLFTLFLVPGDLVMLALFVAPVVVVVALSFGTTDIVGRPHFGSTSANYEQILQGFYIPTIVRTVAFAAITTVLCLALGYPLAYFVVRFAGRWGAVIVGAILLTWLVDYLVRIFAWTTILSDDGLINRALGGLGLGHVHLLGTNAAVVVGLVYSYLPLAILPLVAALQRLDPALIEAGKDLYGSPRATFLHVTLPETIGGVVGAVLLVGLPALGDFATAQFLGGPQSAMIGNLISDQLTQSGSQTVGAALTVALLVLLIAGTALTSLLVRRGWRRAGIGEAIA
jgi:spermidine/putrescine transport system permease protein